MPHDTTPDSQVTGDRPTAPGRRGVVALAGASALGVASAAALAACGSGSTGSTAAGTAGPGGNGASPSAGASSATASPSAAGPKALAKLADVPVGGGLVVTGPTGKPIVVTQPSAGTVAAVSALCTHQGCKVLLQDKQLNCPCHGSEFDLAGKVLQGPATTRLPSVPVRISGTDVVAG